VGGVVRAPNRQPEQALQRAVVHYLAVALTPASWFSTFPAGGGGYLRGAILKGIGLKAGVPDLLLIHAGRVRFLELKSGKGRVSEAQEACAAALLAAGTTVVVVRSLEAVKQALLDWDIPTRDVLLESRRAA
jgi:hypothetical protein